jgi:hypothetical protein
LEKLTLPVQALNIQAPNIEKLRQLPNVKLLAFAITPEYPYLPVTTSAQFWGEFEHLGWLRALQAAGFNPRIRNRTVDGQWDVDLSESAMYLFTALG